MPPAHPTSTTQTAPPATITRTDVTGMTPADTHEAILRAIDAGVLAITDTAATIAPAITDAEVARLADARKVLTAHAPYTLTTGDDEGTWCFAAGAAGPPWPCPIYRAAAAVIADGVGR